MAETIKITIIPTTNIKTTTINLTMMRMQATKTNKITKETGLGLTIEQIQIKMTISWPWKRS
jgi:hypothetical protein